MLRTYLASLLRRPFEYTPLHTDRSIRVVTLHNASVIPNDTDRIDLTIEERSLDSPGEYWALSYVCGDTSPVASVRVNERFFGVGENLHVALRYAWKHFAHTCGGALWAEPGTFSQDASPKSLSLWVDAICISQSDNAEKSQQVKLMTEIFEKAQRILCWLGEEDEDFYAAYVKLQQIRTWYDEQPLRLGGAAVNKYVMDNVGDSELLVDADGKIDMVPWEALGRFLARPYWRRTWILQECTTRNLTTYICGDSGIASKTLEVAMIVYLGCLLSNRHQMLERITGLEEVLRRTNLKALRMQTPQELNMLEVADLMRKYDAANPRDKVYACIGIANDGTRLRVDYSLPVIEVYIDLVRGELEKGTLDVLGYVGRSVRPPAGLPSWVPDWTTYVKRRPFPKRFKGESLNGRSPVYHADSFLRSSSSSWNIDLSSRQLLLQGIYVDTIMRVGESGSGSLFDVSAEVGWAGLYGHAIYNATGETKLVAYFRTLVADVVMKDGKVTSRASQIQWPNEMYPHSDLLHITSRTGSAGSTQMSGMKEKTSMRRFALTQMGYMGLVPSYADVGDEIWVLDGGQVLYTLRDTGGRDFSSGERRHEFLGEAYIHGLMDGEVADLKNTVENVVLG